MKKIVIACDSFKGSLSSEQVAVAVERGIYSVFPDCEVHRVSVADGGEGTTVSLMHALKGCWMEAEVYDPLMRPIKARYGIADEGRTAILEMAAASGLTLLPPHERNPMKTSTYGIGQLIMDAYSRGCRRFIVGIGGSATNDGGTGMLRALGFRFFDASGHELTGGGEILSQIASIDSRNAQEIMRDSEFTVACDVNNPLTGRMGAAYVFAPQKGATGQMVAELDKGLRNYARVIREFNGEDVEHAPGAGAAGGLGAGFKALLGAELRSGIDLILDAVGFDGLLEGCDLVITGEGRIDNQTIAGKVPWGVLRAAEGRRVPVVAIAGEVLYSADCEKSGFAGVFPIQQGPSTLEEAMKPESTSRYIETTVRQIMNLIKRFDARC